MVKTATHKVKFNPKKKMAFTVNVNKVNGVNVTNYVISITPDMLVGPMRSSDGFCLRRGFGLLEKMHQAVRPIVRLIW